MFKGKIELFFVNIRVFADNRAIFEGSPAELPQRARQRSSIATAQPCAFSEAVEAKTPTVTRRSSRVKGSRSPTGRGALPENAGVAWRPLVRSASSPPVAFLAV